MKDSSSNLSNVTSAHEVPAHQAFHLVGIGGAGMSVVAHLLHDMGYAVSGSDRQEADTLPELRELGVKVYVGHRAEQVPAGAILVVTSAVREDNPEVVRAEELGLEIWHRSQALDFCTRSHDLVAVAGAHGKTTTSAMIAAALLASDADPSFAIGGVIAALGTGARLGKGNAFVIEADESDGSFLNYAPLVEVLTNIEADHLDHWGSEAAFDAAFVEFTERLRDGGTVVACGDDPGVQRLWGRFNPAARRISYGFGAGLPGADLVVKLGEPSLGAGIAVAPVEVSKGHGANSGQIGEDHVAGETGEIVYSGELRLAVGGKHMLLNAAGALGVASALGLDLGQFAAELGKFSGANRRMQFVGEVEGVRIYDDYGHHPTEIEATLEAARALAGEGRLLVCFQPHLYSRTFTFQDEFAKALSLADEVVICGVYAAREAPLPGVNGNTISEKMGARARFVEDMFAAGDAAFAAAHPGDLLLFLGAGSITHVAHKLAAGLGEGDCA